MIGIQAAFYLPDQLIYPFYLFFGYGLVSGKIRCKKRLAFWTLIVSWLAMIFAAYLRFACGKKNLSPLLDSSSLIVVIMACSSFVLLHDLRLRETLFAARILLALDRTSFGIYLFHMVFIMIFLRGFAYNPYASPWGGVFILGLWLAISMLSYLLVNSIAENSRFEEGLLGELQLLWHASQLSLKSESLSAEIPGISSFLPCTHF